MKLGAMQPQSDDQPFSSKPEESFTIPARYYHNPEIYEHEKEAIFYNSWWFVGQISPSGYTLANLIFQPYK